MRCLVVEDSPAGVTAGRAANMFVLAVPDVRMDRAKFHHAHQIVSSLEYFDYDEWGLP
jgi:beta-phosphoglucomutase-like phosphatase (HAD superfamily)